MKYSIHDTKEESDAEIARVEAYLGIPTVGTIKYADSEQVDGKWRFRVKESGQWKVDDVAENVQFVEEPSPDFSE